MTYTDKSRSSSFQDKLSKRNEINRQWLIRELSNLKETERRDARTIDIAKQRFRSRCKKLGIGPVVSSNCNVTDVRMYETHNPGFCYHCNGAIKETGSGSFDRPIVNEDDSYEYVRAMLFTNGHVDPEKLLCLHLMTAHTSSEGSSRSNGAWNDILPCYVIEIESEAARRKSQRGMDRVSREKTAGKETPRDFELSYEIRASDGAARLTDTRGPVAKMAARGHREMAISGYDFAPRETCIRDVENASRVGLPRLDDVVGAATCCTDRRIRGACTTDRKTTITSPTCGKIDRSLTTLKKTSEREIPRTQDDSIAIKSSFRSLDNSGPTSTEAKRNWPKNRQLRRRAMIKFRQSVYLNLPIGSFALDDRDYRVVEILVNEQIRDLVRSTIRVLERLDPDKIKWILETSGERKKIRDLLARDDVQKFVESLLEQPIVTSPRNYVVTQVIAVDRIDARLGNLIGDQLVALGLEIPASPALELLLTEMRNNIFGNSGSNDLAAPNDVDNNTLKPQKISPDISHSDPDRVILGRMTNSQRILVGRTCAALKNRRINNEGLIREKTPLSALITPVLSRESIKSLTRGTIYSKFSGATKEPKEKGDRIVTRSKTLTGSMLAKVRRDVAERETKRRFDSFFAN